MKCPHCQKEFNAGKLMGGAKTPKKTAAAKKRGEWMKKAFANQKAMEGSPKKMTADNNIADVQEFVAELPRTSPMFPTDTRVMPKGSLSKEDLKAMLGGSRVGKSESPREEVQPFGPHAPFDFNDEEGSRHRVRAYGKTLKVCFLRDGVEEPLRALAPGELERLWGRRIQ
jgi:hypothetical protein